MREFDIIVAGGGHAGIEAAMAGARMGCSVALITMEKNKIGQMSCNPAIGGTAKGHLVHEIDALGGVMGEIADKTGIQFRVLNKSKGPAVWSSRCQSDRDLYSKEAVRVVEKQKNLTIIESTVEHALEEDKKIVAVITSEDETIYCKALIITCGTFLNGKMFTGLDTSEGGRFGERAATKLSQSFLDMGFEIGRLKTGTPPRISKASIDFDAISVQAGDEIPEPFSLRTEKAKFPFLPQIPCHLTYTSEVTHDILRKGFEKSPLFTGRIKGVGPRYCPSIEDKIVRFADKKKHQLFLEPEGLSTDMVYVNGFSTSLPAEIQCEALHSIKGLENAQFIRYGYAIEYDFFPPYQVDLTLEAKCVQGLYMAGQINGTSGYEEAAAQGLVAGINASLKIQKRQEFVLGRDEAYIGVLIDDLINKSTKEPYRMFTSRAEYRLLLRQDNADRRLYKYGNEFGLISDEAYKDLVRREKLISVSKELLDKIQIHGRKVNLYLTDAGSSAIDGAEKLGTLCRRPHVHLKGLLEVADRKEDNTLQELYECERSIEQVEIELKYAGYIKRQQQQIKKFQKLEVYKVPIDLDYASITALSIEGREKLSKVKPRNLGQASRISGVTPADISVLMVYLKR